MMKVTPEQMNAELRRRRVELYGDHPDEVLTKMASEEAAKRARARLAKRKQPSKS